VSRIDKYEPMTGGTRVPLAAALTSADVGKIRAVSINTSGRAVIGGAAATDLQGVIVPVRPMAIGEIIDVGQDLDVVEATTTAGAAFTAGARVYGHTDGTVDAVATAGKLLGTTVELDRVVFRVPLT
jgi:hypothetical protein